MDLTGIVSLFFEASKEWTEPKVARLENLGSAIDDEPEVKKLKAKVHRPRQTPASE